MDEYYMFDILSLFRNPHTSRFGYSPVPTSVDTPVICKAPNG